MRIEGVLDGYDRQHGGQAGYSNPLRIKKRQVHAVVFDDVDLSGVVITGSENEGLLAYILSMPMEEAKERLGKYIRSFPEDERLIFKLLLEVL